MKTGDTCTFREVIIYIWLFWQWSQSHRSRNKCESGANQIWSCSDMEKSYVIYSHYSRNRVRSCPLLISYSVQLAAFWVHTSWERCLHITEFVFFFHSPAMRWRSPHLSLLLLFSLLTIFVGRAAVAGFKICSYNVQKFDPKKAENQRVIYSLTRVRHTHTLSPAVIWLVKEIQVHI